MSADDILFILISFGFIIALIIIAIMNEDRKFKNWRIDHLEKEVDKWFGMTMRYSNLLSEEQIRHLHTLAEKRTPARVSQPSSSADYQTEK